MTWIQKLQRLVSATSAKLGRQDVEDEYQRLEMVGPAPGNAWMQHDTMVRMGLCQAAMDNPSCNRYSNLFPFDSGRVLVTGAESDYINASWIDVEGVRGRLILTMGPMHPDWFGEDTVTQFWRMVAQQGVTIVVMMCAVQKGFGGCSGYFPTDRKESVWADIKVRDCDKVSKGESSVVRTLELETEGAAVREVTHMQFTAWPNYGVVENVTQLADFVMLVVQERERMDETKPMVIHCSGGIGRSGAFAAVYCVYKLILDSKERGWHIVEPHVKDEAISLESLVRQMREVRHPWMVEGDHQYMLAYSTLLCLLQRLLDSEGKKS